MNTDFRWLEEMETYRWWKKRSRRKYLQSAVLILLLEAVMIALIVGGLISIKETSQSVFGIAALAAFLGIALWLISRWIKSFSWKPTAAWRGIVADKSRYSNHRVVKSENNRAFFVRAQVGSQILEGRCPVEFYKKLDEGSEVVIFGIDGSDRKELYAISPRKD